MSKRLTTTLFILFSVAFCSSPTATSSPLPGLSPPAISAATTSPTPFQAKKKPSKPATQVVSKIEQYRRTFTCESAQKHSHDDVVEAMMVVGDWAGCALTGKIDGKDVTLFGGGDWRKFDFHGFLHVQYDRTCGQILMAKKDLPPVIGVRVGSQASTQRQRVVDTSALAPAWPVGRPGFVPRAYAGDVLPVGYTVPSGVNVTLDMLAHSGSWSASHIGCAFNAGPVPVNMPCYLQWTDVTVNPVRNIRGILLPCYKWIAADGNLIPASTTAAQPLGVYQKDPECNWQKMSDAQ